MSRLKQGFQQSLHLWTSSNPFRLFFPFRVAVRRPDEEVPERCCECRLLVTLCQSLRFSYVLTSPVLAYICMLTCVFVFIWGFLSRPQILMSVRWCQTSAPTVSASIPWARSGASARLATRRTSAAPRVWVRRGSARLGVANSCFLESLLATP